jgi:hypothetical protein
MNKFKAGSEHMALGVECPKAKIPSHCRGEYYFANGECSKHQGNCYRILTDAEVEESFNTAELDMLKRGTALVTAMGTVKLIPWKKEG